MTEDPRPNQPRKRLFDHHHKKRPLRTWIVPLLVIVAVMLLLTKVIGLIEK
ncbi:MAG: hypothetical protein KAH56_07295 [Candidatus Krumholzibacteria bacterium]|nr:hypothetical protein [Candidatus Krumholzibacteria bacterium]